MNRRSFMRMLGIGVPAAAVLTKVPVVEEAMGVAPEVPMFAQGVMTMSCATSIWMPSLTIPPEVFNYHNHLQYQMETLTGAGGENEPDRS